MRKCKYMYMDSFGIVRCNIKQLSDELELDIKELNERCVGKECSYHHKHEEVKENNSIKPGHYNSGSNDVIAFCFEHNVPFWAGNVIKYTFRAGKKDKDKEIEDLLKAKEYLNRRIEYLKGE